MTYFQPLLPAVLLIMLAGLYRVWRKAQNKPWLLAIGIAGLVLVSMTPVAWLASRPLEIWYDQNPIPGTHTDAIVVLAGSIHSPLPNTPYPVLGSDTYIRLLRGIFLFKQWMAQPILVTGGGGDSEAFSHTVRHFLETEGIPPDKIWIECESRSTHENAMYSAKALSQRGVTQIALVTDARSMVRAAASFRHEGIAVVPVPFRFYNLTFSVEDWIPTWRAIEANGETAHELVGIVWYRLRGWI